MNDFEQICTENEDQTKFELDNENVISFEKGSSVASVTFSQIKYANRVRKLAKKFPDEVKIRADYGLIVVATIPTRYIKISPPRVVSEEQKRASAERLSKSSKGD